MNNKPKEITQSEWDELLATKEFVDQFGVDDFESREDFIDWVYGVKFDFAEDCPGYAGDLFMFMSGVLDVDQPVLVYRDRDEGLKVLRALD